MALVPDARRLATVLACGPSARLAAVEAGATYGLCVTRGLPFTVVVAHGEARPGRRAGIHVRESRLGSHDVAVVRGIPVTSVARTIVDIAATQEYEFAEEVIDNAIDRGLFDAQAMDRQLATHRRGVGIVRRILAERHPRAHDARSRWERAMLRLLDAHGLPQPQVNVRLPALRVELDLLWPDAMVVVEWDSWTHHRGREVFERDRRKTVNLQRAGYAVLRFTSRQTRDEPEWVVAAIRAALAEPHITRAQRG